MGADGFGSSVIFAAAAVLWLAYLIPTWLRRREYLATERNALRLQQTLRIMAESAEIPEVVHAETSARNVVQQERVLKRQRQHSATVAVAEEAALARDALRQLAETKPAIAADVAITSIATRRLRRSRAITSTILLFALIAIAMAVSQLLTPILVRSAPVSSGAWAVLGSAAVIATGSLLMLGQMASVGRARVELAHTLRNRGPVIEFVTEEQLPAVVVTSPMQVRRSWTPVSVPRPLYMNRPAPDRAISASLDAAADLRQATVDAERRLREQFDSPRVTPIRRTVTSRTGFGSIPVGALAHVPTASTSSSAAASGRFARMGFVDAEPGIRTDLDEVLRRRRAVAS